MSIIFTSVYEKVSYTQQGFGEQHLEVLIEIRHSFYCLGMFLFALQSHLPIVH